MAARQKRDDDLVDDILLADNDFGEFGLQCGHFIDDVMNIVIFCCHVLKNAVLRLDFVGCPPPCAMTGLFNKYNLLWQMCDSHTQRI